MTGAGRKAGTLAASGRTVVWTDVDMTCPNDKIPALLAELKGFDQVRRRLLWDVDAPGIVAFATLSAALGTMVIGAAYMAPPCLEPTSSCTDGLEDVPALVVHSQDD